MSKIDFRTGALNGRLGGMVGAAWKGIDYVRKMVIPFNPKSTAQTETRTVFAGLVAFGRRIVTTTLNPYMKPKPKKMSPFNKFISINQPMIDAGTFAYADLKTAKGSLFQPPTVALDAGDDQSTRNVTWSNALQGEATDQDKIIIVLYNEDQDIYGFSDDTTRSDQAKNMSLGGETGETFHCYLFASQGETLNSDSAYATDDVSA